jgi:hypothetical protein
MWPDLFGPGWMWDVLASAGLLAIVAGASGALLGRLRRGPGRDRGDGDRLQNIWHRYEEGDLTSWEFARLLSQMQAVQYPMASARARVPRRATAH